MNVTCDDRIETLLAQLTLEEKIGMIHGAGLFRTAGVPRLGIPPFVFSDGPMGVRCDFADDAWVSVGHGGDRVSYLPCNSAIASTWDTALARRSGETLGAEARGRGKDMILAPGINIKRSPLCGRNFEYLSEDPFLAGELGAALVEGIQQNDVSACPKHFAANNQETERFTVDTVVDERTLQEIYLPAFHRVVQAGAWAIMGAYNKLGGTHCCTGQALLGDVLRRDWNFDGLIVSDWGGVHDTAEAAASPLDVEMDIRTCFDDYYMAQPLLEKIRAGELPESLLDDKIRHILQLMLRLHMLPPDNQNRRPGAYNTPEHRAAALALARESVVLLKNEGGLLPLAPERLRRVLVIGANAARCHADGGGSAEIKALYEVTPLLGIRMVLGGNVEVQHTPGYLVPAAFEREQSWQAEGTASAAGPAGREATAEEQAAARAKALALAKEADAVIFVGGLDHDFDVEGQDRLDMRLPYGQDELLDELLLCRPDTVVVMLAGSPVEMPWLPRSRALVWSYYNGMEGGTALAEVLFGRVNPSGKLAESFPARLNQCPAHALGCFGQPEQVSYREGVFVGYRHYDTAQTPVNFCFGHGLSYTRFSYRDLTVTPEEEGWTVQLRVRNEGGRAGREIVQMYVASIAPRLPRPAHELKGFAAVALEPGEETVVTLALPRQALACYDPGAHAWVVDRGRYAIQLGASSRDLRLTATVELA